MSTRDPMVRYRFEFGKEGPLIYTSNLDIARIWERTLRRAGAPVLYSQGFNPRPRIQIAAAMPLGFSSECELMDVWLAVDAEQPHALVEAVRPKAPEGLVINSAWEVDLDGPPLQTVTTHADYIVTMKNVAITAEALRQRADDLLAQETIMVERKRKKRDMRPRLLKLAVRQDDPLTLHIQGRLSQQEGHLRPDHVLEWLGIDPLDTRIHREKIYYEIPVS